jgi:diguanylate cyclase (GGDEF)-like protein
MGTEATAQKQREILMFTLTNSTQFKRHKLWLVFTVGVVNVAALLALSFGNAKPFGVISGLDVVGEGSIVLLTLAWMLAALASRPPGKVTLLLMVGLGCFLFSVSLDFLDEFLTYPDNAHWISMIESYPAALGMLIMTGALYQWHLEQRALNLQLRRREWDCRDHQDIDAITQLYRAEYWKNQIHKLQQNGLTSVVAIIDINGFSAFNLRYGQREGDRYLHEVAQLIVMNLREQDLVCRYAGDRFAILLPEVTLSKAQAIIDELKLSIEYMAFRNRTHSEAIYTTARSSLSVIEPGDNLPTVLHELLIRVEQHPQHVA